MMFECCVIALSLNATKFVGCCVSKQVVSHLQFSVRFIFIFVLQQFSNKVMRGKFGKHTKMDTIDDENNRSLNME